MIDTIIYLVLMFFPSNNIHDNVINVAMVDTSYDVVSICKECVSQQNFIAEKLSVDNNHAFRVSSVIKRYCDDCKIMLYGSYLPIPYLTDMGQAVALFKACRSQNDIINYSMIIPKRIRTFSAIVRYCVFNGKLIVAAAGNDPSDRPNYPCAYPNVICVGSLDTYKYKLTKSSQTTNNGFVDFYQSGAYRIDNTIHYGTSFATAAVTGRVHRVWQRHPELTNIELQSYLFKNMIEVDSQVRIIND